MTEDRLKNIQEMEKTLNDWRVFLKNAENILAEWKNIQPKFEKLQEYYESDLWQQDYEASNNGEISKNISCGVLSEDAVYNALIEQRELEMSYLKFIASILK